MSMIDKRSRTSEDYRVWSMTGMEEAFLFLLLASVTEAVVLAAAVRA
jgi:hypothetical protein